MKLQVAIDKTNLEQTKELIKQLDGAVDIIEFGTPLIKRYGLETLYVLSSSMKNSVALYDTKTNDEGPVEAKYAIDNGAQIITVMGATDLGTIKDVYDVALASNKEVLIDLLEVSNHKIEQLLQFNQAIFGIHNPPSLKNVTASESVEKLHADFPEIKRIAAAGGIDLEQAKKLKEQQIAEIVIVGGKIIGDDAPVVAANKFMDLVK